MAATQESHNRSASALYYLSLYQARYPTWAVWRKMVEMAQNRQLTGYPSTWQQQLMVSVRRYYPVVLQSLLTVAVVVGMLLLLRQRRVGRGWWVVYGCYLLLVGAFMELLAPPTAGLVCQPHAALMAAPSAASDWLTTVASGDRLLVRGKRDIWYQVVWRGRMAYIRQHDLLLVQ
ncbi:hypothetical protein F0P96_18490 [Hymenobacter busanensis]|uniref:Uncharacterized protein n=1 Tax=Hymenobacter busanensis TaxID=2607656 RepID=A0A7L4ZRT3_9BACT|nr:hypothetical protein [Hymenobacter busanensis]KAA9327223.1 hypothetical protein F0P96_18490 [Hymenobacter busanensis]QHJ05889.1 hypothetical protein GUY19_00695 [Hymenobacter busanensis]